MAIAPLLAPLFLAVVPVAEAGSSDCACAVEGGEAEGPGCGLPLEEEESVLARPAGLVSALGGVDDPPSSWWCLRIMHGFCTIMGKVAGSVREATVTGELRNRFVARSN